MSKIVSAFSFSAAVLGLLIQAGAAGATGPTLARTWVSGSIGLDSNPCTRALPCATFAQAITQTIAGGEIDVLDGGEFGRVTITKAITIANDGPGTAAITPVGGNRGIYVNAGGSDAVVLRGLSFNGVNTPDDFDLNNGVYFVGAASLLIDHCQFQGFQFSEAIKSLAASKLSIKDTELSNDGRTAAILIAPFGGIQMAELERVQILNAIGNGVRVDSTGTGAADVELHDVTVDGASGGSAIVAVSPTSGGPTATILADHVTVTHSPGYAFKASGGTASVYLRGSVAENNGVGLGVSGGGQIFSYGDNSAANNTSGAGVTPTAVPLE